MGRSGSGVKAASKTTIQIEFVYKGVPCRERIKLEPTTLNLEKAERHRQTILRSIVEDTFDYAVTFPDSKNSSKFQIQSDLKVSVWLNKWIDLKTPHIKTSTLHGYNKVLPLLKTTFGDMLLKDVKKKDVVAWCEQQTASNKTIANRLSVLCTSLQRACDDELIPFNPIDGFKFSRIETPKKSKVDPFTQTEQETILSATTGHLKNLIQFAFWTGMRTSELCALRWGDIDWVKNLANVERAKTQYALKDETTKTIAGERQVKLLFPALQALLAQKELTFTAGQHIFLNPYDELPWKGDDPIRKAWVIALRKAGVRYRNPYQTRHTYASLMLTAGESLPWISVQMGHSNSLQTIKSYARYIGDSHLDAGEKAVAMFSKSVV